MTRSGCAPEPEGPESYQSREYATTVTHIGGAIASDADKRGRMKGRLR
jgi:hypothetical protein